MLNNYRGHRSHYVDIGSRGSDCLGLGIEYVQSQGTGYVVVRFVTHSDPVNGPIGEFNHFHKREPGEYVVTDENGQTGDHVEVFKGFRLNKSAIPLFTPAVNAWEALSVGTELGVISQLTVWIKEQAELDNFVVPGGEEAILEVIQKFLTIQPPSATTVSGQKVFQLPNLADDKKAQAHHHFIPDEENEDGDDEGDDSDSEELDDSDD